MDSLIYEKLKIDLGRVPIELLREYLQVRYWLNLARKPSSANRFRYKMAAQHLSNARDFARLQQLCAEVPELKDLVMPQPAENDEPTEETQVRCCDCYYYTGDSGNKFFHVICAVNPKVEPSRQELRKARGKRTEAWHNCQDFKKGHSETTSSRDHTFEFDD